MPPYQQLRLASIYDHRTIPLPLASRALLQMDQAASANQSFLRNFGERGQVTNLDRRLCLRSGRHRQKAIASLGQPVRNPTDPQPDHVRENPAGSTTCTNDQRRNSTGFR